MIVLRGIIRLKPQFNCMVMAKTAFPATKIYLIPASRACQIL